MGANSADRVRGLFGNAPRPGDFYELFGQAGANVQRSTALLALLMREWPDEGNERRLELKLMEQEGDRLTRAVIRHLHQRAASPFPAAEAYELISRLDDVVDFAEEVGDMMGLYRVEAATDQAIELAAILEAAGRELAAAMAGLQDLGSQPPHLVTLNRLEEDGDRVERAALASLFDAGIDPMVVIRWKDIYERLEDGIDSAAHVGHTLEGLVVGRA